ncbi:hypothetical protein RJT34_03609 [Clitoria ternatea]|uniref:Uncharacterized protein n=1 Tax=Clitoria ternatea TaxID=43366 RepID=A0AAN9Q1X1_CLITE
MCVCNLLRGETFISNESYEERTSLCLVLHAIGFPRSLTWMLLQLAKAFFEGMTQRRKTSQVLNKRCKPKGVGE